jgi:hypothetical protein
MPRVKEFIFEDRTYRHREETYGLTRRWSLYFQALTPKTFGVAYLILVRAMKPFLLPCVIVILLSFVGCSTRSGEYVVDQNGRFRKLSEKEAAISTFKSKVHMTAYYEARGERPVDPKYTWRQYWTKVVPYWIGSQEFGSHEEVMAYIAQERKAQGLPPL